MKTALLIFLGVFLSSFAAAAGDTLTLTDGKTIFGDILSFNDTECYISVSGRAQRVPLTQIKRIDFGPVDASRKTQE